MQLKNYQKNAVDKLLKITRKLLAKDGPRICVFKAPTGSGKTIMVADWLNQLAQEQTTKQYAFIWISGNNLHKQSRDKLEKYLEASRYTFSYLEDVQGNTFVANEVAFVNWHSLTKQDRKTGEYKNVYMRDNEQDRNLRTFITNSKENGLEIILIVDESHYHYWSPKSQQLVQEVIAPKLTFEVSATPKLEPKSEDIVDEEAGLVRIKFEDVVAEGMIKSEVVVNHSIGKHVDFHSVADEVILSAAIEKRNDLERLYASQGSPVKPLVIIQLPNEGEKTSALDQTKLEMVERFLKEKYSISEDNGKLAIWLSEKKKNTDNITNNSSEVEVLIFKQAVALGWDCPRAQILVMFRDIRSVTFEIQTVGRILRMPELHHYSNDELNRAYVYTNLDKIQVAQDKESQGYFQVFPAHRKSVYSKLDLPSVYLSRVDYGDLTLTFRQCFMEVANTYFKITDKDLIDEAKRKADLKLELRPDELTKPVVHDAVFENIDEVKNIIGETIQFTVHEDEIKYNYEKFAKAASLPYAPVRSHTKIQQAIYDWFDTYLGYKYNSRLDIQRIVVCSESNQHIFREIIEQAKEQFAIIDKQEKLRRQSRVELIWNVPIIDYFSNQHEQVEMKKYVFDPCYLLKDRSEVEKKFEKYLDTQDKVNWWYKNGVGMTAYFAVDYIDPSTGLTRSFYPDFIVQFADKSIGMYDTKDGITTTTPETAAKSDALQRYIKEFNQSRKIKMVGGIVIHTPAGFKIFDNKKYDVVAKTHDWPKLHFDT